jgi:hypothetical protein
MKKEIKRSLLEEFDCALHEVQRNWLRRIFVIMSLPILIVALNIYGIYAWFKECW